MVIVHNEILFISSVLSFTEKDGTGRYNIKWNKSNTERGKLHVPSHIQMPKS